MRFSIWLTMRSAFSGPPRLTDAVDQKDHAAEIGGEQPLFEEWGATLKVHLSGQEVISEQGELSAYELIAEDVTKQRELEGHLRQQAASDPLTGLANYRHLVDVLSLEIKRCERTTENVCCTVIRSGRFEAHQ